LGSDVPFFAAGEQAAIVEGRGESVRPLPAIEGGAGVLLAASSAELSTSRVFARYDEMLSAPADKNSSSDQMALALRDGMSGAGLAELASEMADANQLWPAAASLSPELVDRRDTLERATDWRWALSGSGPTLFCVLPTLDAAIEAGTRLAAERPPELAGVMLCAVDLDNPDNAWREP